MGISIFLYGALLVGSLLLRVQSSAPLKGEKAYCNNNNSKIDQICKDSKKKIVNYWKQKLYLQ
jgi:hypothetical protein